ncbi:MAG: ABC transporter [Candidatus Magasanikbacteria bacterium RIFOXYC2_FULL_42_28]|uniref:ABC transporter n=1 Tax=Candidatus Magasanikbacteria bacterium RIFOXYC2_FULL_42_28 TaxID=1798704 RepID=A0A1F6NXP9_9BACT|nr:MAG: ABC transporter [Candidatus Magasanikbacteria bacterium RIFOXYC2_FULL_42_28]
MSIIEVNNLGKRYNIGERQGYVALRDVLANIIRAPQRWFTGKVHGNKANDQNSFWALENINFQVEKGDVLGVIGRNGAGKSTLLKILSQITPPTTGEIKLRGRVGSLLEVGTGFHPELTGRENVFLNGAILGMKKNEIKKKFDAIVDFAGIEKFLDTPVKRYSSGMYVRLAFAVAAHLEPDILIVDEVLAVGDIDFQKKCLGRMKEVTTKEGRTVIFVSHNMGAIRGLCNRCILLEDGKIKSIGDTNRIVDEYMSISNSAAAVEIKGRDHVKGNGSVLINTVSMEDATDNVKKTTFAINESIRLSVDYEVKDSTRSDISFWVFFSDREGKQIISSFQKDTGIVSGQDIGRHRLAIDFNELGLLPGKYSVSMGVFRHQGTGIDFADWVDYCLTFEIDNFFANGQIFDQRLGVVDKKAIWKVLF